MDKLKAVIYIRVSDQSQVENNSLGTQLKACQNFAEGANLQIVKTFREEGFSAKHIHNRPQMRELLQYCTTKKNKISRIIVYKMDRWTRNVEEGLVTMTLLAKYGIAVVPATEIADQSPMGNAMRTILMALGELDNSLKSERVKDNMQTMFRKGMWCWKCPLGYMRIGNSKDERRGQPLILNKPFAKIIRSLFDKASIGYYSKQYLADYLNSLGFKDLYGREADGKKVNEILSNTFYYGEMYARKWNEYQHGSYEKLVDQEIWEKAYSNTLGKSRIFKHQNTATFPLKGTLKCAICNHTMTSSNPTSRGKKFIYYECYNKTCKHKQRIALNQAHTQFSTLLESLRPSERVIKLFSHMIFDEWDKNMETNRSEAKLKEEQIQQLEGKITFLAESNSKGILNDMETKERVQKARNEIAVLRIEKSDVKIDEYSTEAVRNFTETFLINLDKLWIELDLGQKQVFQNTIFPNGVVCENKQIRITTLPQSFELIESLKAQNDSLVTPLEFESKFSE